MVLKTLLIIVIFAILMEDSASIKKTPEEEKEEREMAEKVNATLAEEKERQEDEKKRQEKEEKKKQQDQEKTTKEKDETKDKREKGQDEACPTSNQTCPDVGECPPCGPCPEEKPCKECPEERPCKPCRPCGPCPVVNATVDQPPTISCPEVASMSVPVAMAVGAAATLLAAGVAAVLGLLLRYFSPLECGFLFLATIIIVWYLSSHYPDTARELGGRVVELLREATTTLSHRVVEALQRHNEQVVSYFVLAFLLFNSSSMFICKVCTKIFYVKKINF
jgi:hypothetical protein